jgi:hypothetical protein
MAADCKSATLRVTEVRILPCAPLVLRHWQLLQELVSVVDLSPAGSGRMWIALVVLGLLALAVWQTMEPGKFQQLTWILLGFFAFRVILGRLRSR